MRREVSGRLAPPVSTEALGMATAVTPRSIVRRARHVGPAQLTSDFTVQGLCLPRFVEPSGSAIAHSDRAVAQTNSKAVRSCRGPACALRMNDVSTTIDASFGGVHHVSLTVTNLEASIAWYQRVFRTHRLEFTVPHYGREETGYSVLLPEPRSGLIFGLHKNAGNRGERFDEAHTGLDHVSLGVEGRAALEVWAAWLDELGVSHTGIVDETEPITYSTIVFRDPDKIQLELIAME
jgi:catechol 2,3-dioxygenase-like lactoylglutathione lyase family enzyme